MPSSFKRPTGKSLAQVDVAKGVRYRDPCVSIEGVISPHGQGGWDGDGYFVHCFLFAGWRLLGQSMVATELTLLRPVPLSPKGQYKRVFDQFPDYSIQWLSVLLSTDQKRAVVDKVLKISRPDEALTSFAAKLRKPVVISTKEFGDLVMNPMIGWFEGKRK